MIAREPRRFSVRGIATCVALAACAGPHAGTNAPPPIANRASPAVARTTTAQRIAAVADAARSPTPPANATADASTRATESPANAPGAIAVRLLARHVRVERRGDVPASGTADADSDGWTLVDGNASTGIASRGDVVRLRFALQTATAVDGVALRGALDGLASVWGERAGAYVDIDGTRDITLAGSSSNWRRIRAGRPERVDTIVIEWRGASASAQLNEVALWGRSTAPTARPSATLADAVLTGHATPALQVAAQSSDLVVSPPDLARDRDSATARFTLTADPRAMRRAFIVYELTGLAQGASVIRQINSTRAEGGFRPVARREAGTQVEEISPTWLRAGANEIRFSPVRANDAVGYHVRNLRLLAFADDPGERAGGADLGADRVNDRATADDRLALTDGDLESGVTGRPTRGGAAGFDLAFASRSQPSEVTFHIARPLSGTLQIAAADVGVAPGQPAVRSTAAARVAAAAREASTRTVRLDGLAVGWHRVRLDSLGPTSAVRVTVRGGEQSGLVSEIHVEAIESPENAAPEIRLVAPLHGECTVQRGAYVRGFVTGLPAGVEAREVSVDGHAVGGAIANTGAFGLEAPPPANTTRGWQVELGVLLSDGTHLTRTVPLSRCSAEPAEDDGVVRGDDPVEDVGAPYGAWVRANAASTVHYGDVTIDVPAGAVEHDTRLTVRPLAESQTPAMDPGMTNVSRGGGAYRLGPHHTQFARSVRLQLAMDASRIPPGMTADDVQTFYFDEGQHRWRSLQRIAGGNAAVVASLSSHYTDFVNSTIARPESPQPESFNANRIQSLPLADPSAGLTMIEPPTANAMGTANLSFPIWVPPGRGGMQPSLAITYNSEHDNGWVGVGWDLQVSHIEIDTRFGAPRYDLVDGVPHAVDDPTYLLDGAALVPVDGPTGASNANPRVYQRRVEGSFDLIERHGGDPRIYNWVIRDRRGITTRYSTQGALRQLRHDIPYAEGDERRDDGALCVFRWNVTQVTDLFGNTMTFDYAEDRGISPGGALVDSVSPGEPFVQLYPDAIHYTSHATAAAHFHVAFNTSEGRSDVISNARAGFDVRTRRRLDSISIHSGALDPLGAGNVRSLPVVRQYELHYPDPSRETVFRKSLLDHIDVVAPGATPDAPEIRTTHRFEYFQPEPATPGGQIGFPAVTEWTSGAPVPRDTTHSASHDSVSGFGFLGISGPFCFGDIGVGAGVSGGSTSTHRLTLDVNGDGTPDILDRTPDFTGPRGTSRVFLNQFASSTDRSHGRFVEQSLIDAGDFTETTDIGTNFTAALHLPLEIGSLSYDLGVNWNTMHVILADADGDGFVDLVSGPRRSSLTVERNPFVGVPEPGESTRGFGSNANGSYLIGGWTDFQGAPRIESTQLAGIRRQLHRTDAVVRWTAPSRAGHVRITGPISRSAQVGTDGVIATIYRATGVFPGDTTRVWQHQIDQDTLCRPGPANGCDGGLEFDIARGDRLFFRVGGMQDPNGDATDWDPTIEFTSTEDCPPTTGCGPSGPPPVLFHRAADFRLADDTLISWSAPETGTVDILGAIVRDETRPLVGYRVIYRQVRHAVGAPLAQPSDTFDTNLFPATAQIAAGGDESVPVTAGGLHVSAGDQLIFVLRMRPGDATTVTDPNSVRWTPEVRYRQVCRTDPPPTATTTCYAVGPCTAPPGADPRMGICTLGDLESGVPAEGQSVGAVNVSRVVDVAVAETEHRGTPPDGTTAPTNSDSMTGWYRGWAQGQWNADATSPDCTTGDPSCVPSGAPCPDNFCERNFRHDLTETQYRALEESIRADATNAINLPATANMEPMHPYLSGTSAPRSIPTDSWAGSGPVSFVSTKAFHPSIMGGAIIAADGRVTFQPGDRFTRGGGVPGIRESVERSEGASTTVGPDSASGGTGVSTNQLDFFDINGDRRPDSISRTDSSGSVQIQARTADTFESYRPLLSYFMMRTWGSRHVTNTNGRASVGVGSAGGTRENKSGSSGLTQFVMDTRPSIGGGLGVSTTDTDWIDINGDGLVDHVHSYPAGGAETSCDLTLEYQLNMGGRLGRRNRMVLIGRRDGTTDDHCAPVSGLRDEQNATGSLTGSYYGIGGGGTYSLTRTVADFVDLNGDGLPDRVSMNSGEESMLVQFNLGDRFARAVRWRAPTWGSTLSDPFTSAFTGSNDVLAFQASTTGSLSLGGAGVVPLGPFACLVGQLNVPASFTQIRAQLSFEDIDGDGRMDHVLKREGDSRLLVRLNNTGRVNLLRRVINPLGGSFELDYYRQGNRVCAGGTTGCEPTNVDMPRNQWALRSVQVSDGTLPSCPAVGIALTTAQTGHCLRSTVEYFDSGYHDRAERENYGYARVRVTRADDSYVETQYHNQDYYRRGLVRRVIEAAPNPAAPTLPLLHVVSDTVYAGPVPDPRGLNAEVTPASTFFPAATDSTTAWYEGRTNIAAPGRTTHQSRVYDPGGRRLLLSMTDDADEGTADDVTYQIGYTALRSDNVVRANDVVACAGTTNPCPAPSILRHRIATYDATTAALTSITDRLVGGRVPGAHSPYDGTINPTTRYEYTDGYGNLTAMIDPRGYRIDYAYDGVVHTYRTSIQDSLGYHSSAQHDVTLGVAVRTVDVAGALESRQHDRLGRLTDAWGPYEHVAGARGHEPAVHFDYDFGSLPAFPPHTVTRQRDQVHDGDTLDTAVFTDGLGRTIQTRRDSLVDGGSGPTQVGVIASGPVGYDDRGRATSQAQPSFVAGGDVDVYLRGPDTNPTITAYDVRSRPTRVTAPDGTHTDTAYGFEMFDGVTRFATTVIDPLHRPRTVFRDVADRIRAIREFNTIRGTVTPLLTRYSYDRNGQLTRVTDALNHPICAAYDTLGQMVRLDSIAPPMTASPPGSEPAAGPDVCNRVGPGVTEYLFDLSGNLRERQTANLRLRGEFIVYRYADGSNRLDGIDYPRSTDVALTYGLPTATDFSAGRLIQRVDGSGTETRAYGALGELIRTDRTLRAIGPGGIARTYAATTRFRHDSLGRMLSMTYPDGAQLSYHYDLGGRLDAAELNQPTLGGLSERTPVVDRITYDAFGQRSSVTLGNGVATRYRYDPLMRRLAELDSDTHPRGPGGGPGGSSSPMQRLRYDYNDVGNIIGLHNRLTATVGGPGLGGPTDFSFTFDGLDQLTGASATYRSERAALVSTASIPFTRQFTLGMQYNEIGRIERNIQNDVIINPAGRVFVQADTSHDLTYAYTDPRPHATTLLTDPVNGRRNIEHDADGNQTQWVQTVGRFSTLRTIAWDEEDRMASVDDSGPGSAVTFAYDADGARTHKFQGANRTEYVSQFWTVRNEVTPTRHVFADGVRVASMLTPSGFGAPRVLQFYYHTDHLQSVQYVTDGNGNAVEHHEYFPFGEDWVDEQRPVASLANTSPEYRFTGHEEDPETGFTYAGARYYDARSAQWCSEDPALASHMGGGSGAGAFTPHNLGGYSYGWNSPLLMRDADGRQAALASWLLRAIPGAGAAYTAFQLGMRAFEQTRSLGMQGVHAAQLEQQSRDLREHDASARRSSGPPPGEPPPPPPDLGPAVAVGTGLALANSGIGTPSGPTAGTATQAPAPAAAAPPGGEGGGGGGRRPPPTLAGLADLAQFRSELGLQPGQGTLARLDVGGRSFYGINAHGQAVTMRVNAISASHAETDAFQQAANAGARGDTATLYVDRPLCDPCGRFGAVRSLARQLGLSELRIVTPQGTYPIQLR